MQHWLADVKVHNKLILVYLVTGLLPMCLMFTLFYTQMKEVLVEREIDNLQGIFQQAVDRVNTQITLYQSMSDYIAFNQTIVQIVYSENKNDFDAYQKIVKEFDPMMDSLRYFYPGLIQTTVYVENLEIPHGDYLRPIQELQKEPWGKISDNESHWYADEEKNTVFFLRSMPLLDGGTGGLLYIAIDDQTIFSLFDLTVNEDYGLFVYDSENTKLYEKQQYTKENGQYMDFASFQILKDEDDPDYILLEQTIGENGWTAACCMPKNRMISPLQPVLLLVILVWILCVCFSVVIIMHFSRNLSHRLIQLSQTMTVVEEGNLNVELMTQEKDEIGDLTRGFDQMLSKIRQLIQEVYESKIRQKQYEMTALRAQINPHFLYNSLSLINWKALEIGADDISKATLALSRYYRTSLNKGKSTMSIREELDNVRSYLQIQEMFHDYSFDVVMDVQEEILEFQTLNLILQPLAENAIVHGIDRKRNDRGKITITGRKEKETIILTVEDNGVGMEMEKAQTILNGNSNGYGVKNVNSRIHLQYGEMYGLLIVSEPSIGTKVTVCIPAVKKEEL